MAGRKLGGFLLCSKCPVTSVPRAPLALPQAACGECLLFFFFFCHLQFSAYHTPHTSVLKAAPLASGPGRPICQASRPRRRPPLRTSLEKRDLGSISTTALPMEVRASRPLETRKIPDLPHQPGLGVQGMTSFLYCTSFPSVLRPASRVS